MTPNTGPRDSETPDHPGCRNSTIVADPVFNTTIPDDIYCRNSINYPYCEILQSLMTHTAITFTLKVTLQSETLGITLRKDSGMNNKFFCFIRSSFWKPSMNFNITELDNRSNLNFFTQILACENGRFSSLFAAGDVSRGGGSATKRQKFHTDDEKFVRSQVRSADWSTE